MDNRPEYADPQRFPQAEAVVCGDYTRLKQYFTLTPEDYAIVMTNGHSFDYEAEKQILLGDFAYLGVIGSRKKTAAVNAKLLADGLSQSLLDQVHTPIGLPILAVTPEEIAVSIAAEMILVRARRREQAGSAPSHACPMH
jgi:xanthine dehydrogenase accessory factor